MSGKKLKKQIRDQVVATLTTTMTGLPGKISPKKVKRNIRKASKMLLAGLKVTPVKKAAVKKAVKKKEKVAVAPKNAQEPVR